MGSCPSCARITLRDTKNGKVVIESRWQGLYKRTMKHKNVDDIMLQFMEYIKNDANPYNVWFQLLGN